MFTVLLAIFICIIKVDASEIPNIVNEFVITGDSSEFSFVPVATFNDNKLYLFFGIDNKYRALCYNLKGEKLGQNKIGEDIYNIRQIDFSENKVSLQFFYGVLNTIRHFTFVYSNDLNTVDKIFENINFDGYISTGATNIPRKGDSLYFIINSTDIETRLKRRYHIITTDLNYRILNIVDLDTSNIDSDIWGGGTPIYYLGNGHFTFTTFKSQNGNLLHSIQYTYEFDFDGKYYSKKIETNKIIYNNDTLDYKGYAVGKMKDFSLIVYSELKDSTKLIKCLIKFAPNGEIPWIAPMEDKNNAFAIFNISYLEKSEIIAASGRFFPDGNTKNPYGSYLQLFDKEGNHLETYAWQRNKYLDCTVFTVIEGPDNHLLIISKNGSDSLVISEIIPKYLSAKENNLLLNRENAYPNPAGSTTHISLQKEGDITISAVDVLGRSFQLWSGYASAGDKELDVSTLPTGSYTLLIDYGTKREAVRMIKQ